MPSFRAGVRKHTPRTWTTWGGGGGGGPEGRGWSGGGGEVFGCPLVEHGVRIFFRVWPVVDSTLGEHHHDLSDHASRREVEMLHDLIAVDRRTERIEFLLLAEHVDSLLEFVNPPRDRLLSPPLPHRDIE